VFGSYPRASDHVIEVRMGEGFIAVQKDYMVKFSVKSEGLGEEGRGDLHCWVFYMK
jgi:hypothetical protein